MDEFDIIRRYFVPLAEPYAASLGLRDDAALVDVPAGRRLVVTKDALCEGVHFFSDDDAAHIAKKLLRVNLSDLAAKGAQPLCYFLALMLPENADEAWVARFAAGLAEDQRAFGIHLAGGDTTANKGKIALSLTALGTVQHAMLTRSGAKAGDDIYVSGTIGRAAASGWKLLPEPRLKLGQALLEQRLAHACMDISDGLAQDLGHICAASGVGAVIESAKVPLPSPIGGGLGWGRVSAEAVSSRLPAPHPASPLRGEEIETALTAGDDYELLFTAAPDAAEKIISLSEQLHLPLTKIGAITAQKEVHVLDAQGVPMQLKRKGYTHFS